MRTCPECHRAYDDDSIYCSEDGTPLPPPRGATQVELNVRLSQRYRIIQRLGEGGMGSVFLAEQLAVGGRSVALKVLRRRLLDDPEFLRRFQEEASSTGRIHHQNVVTVYECGQTDDGSPYIAMEFLEGESLGQAIERRGALPLPEAAEILQQAARGLNAAHKLGIIHRDLKPDNIFLTKDDDGRLLVKIVDFGIAKIRESQNVTVTGLTVGTPAYMSFEQASGMRSEEIDGRSDVYSLGVVAYEMITGRLPFRGDTPIAFLKSHLLEPPEPIGNVPPQMEQVVMKALSKQRDERYATAPDFAREFGKAVVTVPEPSVPKAATPEVTPRRPSSSVALIVVVNVLIAVIVVAVIWYLLAKKTGTQTSQTTGKIEPSPSQPPQIAPTPVPAGRVRINPKDGQQYVWIPAGSYLMGCSAGDTECDSDEKPPHRVTLTKGFWMGQTAVTVIAWKRYRAATGTKALPTEDTVSRKNWNEAGEDNMPAVMMNWTEARSYCEWAGMRLPTEAEREYAARAGTTTPRYGDLESIAWYGDNSGAQPIDSAAVWNRTHADFKAYLRKLYNNGNFVHAVGEKQPNAWNLYDILGNVYDWTSDWYDASYYAKSPEEDPSGPPSGKYRTARGGSWLHDARLVRASYRNRDLPDSGYSNIGTRCVGELP